MGSGPPHAVPALTWALPFGSYTMGGGAHL